MHHMSFSLLRNEGQGQACAFCKLCHLLQGRWVVYDYTLKHLRSQATQEAIHQLTFTEIGDMESNLVHSIDVTGDCTSLPHLHQLGSGRIQGLPRHEIHQHMQLDLLVLCCRKIETLALWPNCCWSYHKGTEVLSALEAIHQTQKQEKLF